MGINAGSLTFFLDESGTRANIEGIVKLVEDVASNIKPIKLKFEADSGDPVRMLSDIRSLVEEISKKSMEMNISLSTSNRSSSSSLKAYKDQISEVSSAMLRETGTINNALSNLNRGHNIWGEEANGVENLLGRLRELNAMLARYALGGLLDTESISKLSGQALEDRAKSIGDFAIKLKALYDDINAATGKNLLNTEGLFMPERAATSAESAEKIAAALASSVAPAQQVGSAMDKISTAGLPTEQFEAIVTPLQNINNILSNLPGAADGARSALEGMGAAGKKSAEEVAAAEAKVSKSTGELSAQVESWKNFLREDITANNMDASISKYVNTLQKIQNAFVGLGGSKDNDSYKAISAEIEKLLAIQTRLRSTDANGMQNLVLKDEISGIKVVATDASIAIENLINKARELNKSERESWNGDTLQIRSMNRLQGMLQQMEDYRSTFVNLGGNTSSSAFAEVENQIRIIQQSISELGEYDKDKISRLFEGLSSGFNNAKTAIEGAIKAQREFNRETMNSDQKQIASDHIKLMVNNLESKNTTGAPSDITDRIKAQIAALQDLNAQVQNGSVTNSDFAAQMKLISAAASEATSALANYTAQQRAQEKETAAQKKATEERTKILDEINQKQQELMNLRGFTEVSSPINTRDIDAALQKYDQLKATIQSSLSTAATAGGNSAFRQELDAINAAVEPTIQNIERLKVAEQTLDSAKLGLDKIEKLQANFLKAGGSRNSADFMNLEGIRQGYISLITEIDNATKSGQDFSKLDFSKLSAQLAALNSKTKIAGSNFSKMKTQGMGFGAQFGAALKSQLAFTFGIQAMARNVIRYTREMVKSAIELDSAMTQLKIVTNENEAAYQNYAKSLSGTAQEVGSSISDLTDSATVYARLGYNLDESAQLSKFTAMLRNVGNIDVSTAQNAMTAIVKAFNIGVDGVEAAMDKMVIVGNNTPISVAEIAEGMNNAGSALQAAGNSFDESVALLTAANTTVQNISKSSTGLRTISARIRKMDTDLNDLGETMTEADYQAMVSALTDASVSLVDSNGQLRSTYDILSDIAAVWERLSANEKAALAETLSGTRQQNVFFSIIEQFQEAQKAMELMGNSEGSLERANDRYMQSTQAHINQFKAAFQGIASEVFTADLMNSFVDVGTSILNVLRGLATALAPVGEGIALITDLLGSLTGALADASTGFSNFDATALSAMVMFIGLATGNYVAAGLGLIGVIGGIKTELEASNPSYEAQVQHVAELQSQYDALTGAESEYLQLLEKEKELAKDGRHLTQEDQNRLRQLEAEAAALEKTLNEAEAIERTKWFEKMNQETTTDMGQSGVTVAQNNLMMIKRAVHNLKEQWKSGEGSAEDFLSTLNDVIATYSDLYTQYKKYQGTDGWTPGMEAFVQYYEALLDGRRAILDAESQDDSVIVKKPKQYKHVEEAIKSATAALEKFNEASKEDNSEVANSYAEAYKKFQADWKAGKIGSNTVKAAIDLFIPDDVQAKLGYDTQKLGELLNSNIYKSVFKGSDASKYGNNLIQYIQAHSSELNGIINLSKDDKGYSIEYSSLQDLANAFGVTTEAAAALISMLQDYSDILIMSKQDTIMLADNLGLLGSKGVSGFTKISEIANKLATLDPSIGASGIVDTLKSLEEAGYIDLSGVENTLGAIAKNAIAVRDAEQSAAENPPDIEISTNSEAVVTAIDGVIAALGRIPELTTTTIHTNYTESGNPPSIGSEAAGTRNFAGGKTLVNERGPELIAENGRAYIAGGGAPAVVDLAPGAIILPADETRKALRNNSKGSAFNSAASGAPTGPKTSTLGAKVATEYLIDTIVNIIAGAADNAVDAISPAQPASPKDSTKLPTGFSTTDDYLAYLAAKDSARNPAPKPSSTSSKDGSGGWYDYGSGGAEDPNKRKKGWFEEALKEHKHLVEMEQETDEEYLKWLDEAYKLAYEDKEFELDDYRKYEEEVYKGLHNLFKDYISDREFEVEALKQAGDNAEQIGKIYQEVIARIEAEIQKAYEYGLTDNDSYVQELYKELWGVKDKVKDLEEESVDDSQKATEKLIKYRMKMIKQELEDEKKAYEERLKNLNEFIDKQKKALRDDAAQEDYLDEQTEKRKKVTDLQLQLNALEFDDSAKAQKKKLQLQEQLAEAQKELDKFERDHAIDVAEQELDHIAELAEESTKKQTDAIDEQLNNQEIIYKRALEDIVNNNRALFEDMIAYEKRYGEGHDAPVVQMWEEAYIALKNYAGLYGELYKGIDLQNFTGYNGTPTVRGYASGTRNASAGIHRLFENGDEYVFTSSNGSTYRMFSGGEKVLNAQASNFLYDFANTRGGILSNLISGIGRSIGHITSSTNEPINIVMGDINISGSASDETVSQIRREQKAGVRYMLEELKKLKR